MFHLMFRLLFVKYLGCVYIILCLYYENIIPCVFNCFSSSSSIVCMIYIIVYQTEKKREIFDYNNNNYKL